MSKINPKRLRVIGSFAAATGQQFTIEQDSKNGRCVISDANDKVVKTEPTAEAAWTTARYLAGVTYRDAHTKGVQASKGWRMQNRAELRHLRTQEKST